jgi:uncharacterized protein (DUF2147 family)
MDGSTSETDPINVGENMRKTVLQIIALLAAVWLAAGSLPAGAEKYMPDENDVAGLWWTPKKDAKIRIFKREGKYYGKIAWLRPKDRGKLDVKNPDKKKRHLKILCSELFFGFKFDGKDTWKDGKVYNAQDGGTYSAYMKMKDPDTMIFSGFMIIPLLGRSETFKRVGSEP